MVSRATTKTLIDLVLWGGLATPLAYLLRLDAHLEPGALRGMVLLTVVLLPLKALLVYFGGLPFRSWHKTGVRDLGVLGFLVGLVMLVSFVLMPFLPDGVLVPRSVPAIEAMIALLLLGAVRLGVRLISEHHRRPGASDSARRVLIAGAGESGTMMARELLRHPEAGMLPVGFLDDDPGKKRVTFGGVPVLGTLDDLPRVAPAHDVDEVIIAMPSASGAAIRRVVESVRQAELAHRIIPGIYDLLSGNVSISQLRKVHLEDLLRRDPVQLETDEISAYLDRRRVLVTGAGGSIGSEIVRQVARFNPACIVLVGRGENSIFLIEQEMKRDHPGVRIYPVICDVRDAEKLAEVFGTHRPEVVFHAAAHKHVPLMEANPDQAVFNNVGGTRNVADLCLETGVRVLVNVSTDKAVNPTSVMGASKRVAEQVVQAASQKAPEGHAFVSVRFGNVLGSRGSVVPFFQAQIERGGPVTVTHPDMVRYFMTIPEAAQLVLQAGGMDMNGAVFVLDMGQPVKIVDLARDLILLSGLEPERDIEIQFTGMRPGEKLFEELLTAEEGTDASSHKQIFVARKAPIDVAAHWDGLSTLLDAAARRDGNGIRDAFAALVPYSKLERQRVEEGIAA